MPTNQGVIFNHLPQALFFETGWFNSFSDLAMHWIRINARNPVTITGDKHLFKQLRKGELSTPDEFLYQINRLVTDTAAAELKAPSAPVSEGLGTWWLVSLLVEQLSQSNEMPDHAFWLKLSALFDDEKGVIGQNSISDFERKRTNILASWLDIDNFDSDRDGEVYTVRIVLIWLSIYEHLLRLCVTGFEEHCKEPAYFAKFMPRVSAKGQKLAFSNTLFCDAFKSRYFSTSRTWTDFYDAVAKASGDPSRAESVKKAVQEIRRGKRELLWSNYQSNFRILRGLTSENNFDLTEIIVLFCQLMTKLQKELLQRGFSFAEIETLFSFYPVAYDKFL